MVNKIIIGLLFGIFVTEAKAVPFECTTFLSLSPIFKSSTDSRLNKKIKVDETEHTTTYLLQKEDDKFVLEVYIPQTPIRIFSESYLRKTGDNITAGAWTRDYIIDVDCRRL